MPHCFKNSWLGKGDTRQTELPLAAAGALCYAHVLSVQFVDRDGTLHTMDAKNILALAPYSIQVNRLKHVLAKDAPVGTVGKFQGQEADAVLVLMTTSSGDSVPHDIDFPYSKSRLNVAVQGLVIRLAWLKAPGSWS